MKLIKKFILFAVMLLAFTANALADEAAYTAPNAAIDNADLLPAENTDDGSGYAASQSFEAAASDNAYQYSIRDIEIKNLNGDKLNSLKGGAFISAVTVVKNTEQTSPAMIYAVIYDNGVLKSAKTVPLDEAQANKTAAKYTLNIPLDEITSETSSKIMVWNKNIMQPYSISLSAFCNYRIDVAAAVNQLYTIPLISKGQANKFKVGYDSEYFSVVDLCKETDTPDILEGIASDNIRIDEVADGSFTFSYISGNQASCVNRVVLKAKKSGNTYLSIEEITE